MVNGKSTSTKKGMDDTGNKGFDPFTLLWTDRRKGLRKFCRLMKKEGYPVLGSLFNCGLYATYKEEALLDVVTHNIITGVSSENGTNSFGDEYKKDHPSPRAIRYRLGKLNFLEVELAFNKINKRILDIIKKKRKFKIPVLLSIDITYVNFYGKRRKFACGMKRDRGTNYGYKYASCVVSAAGIGVAIHTVPMTEFTRNEEILETLIKEAQKYVKIKGVLVDREFFTESCIKRLEELTMEYLMPVIKHRKKFLDSLSPPCKTELPLKSIHVPVIAVRDPDNLEESLYYCTNMDIPLEQLEDVMEIYRKRWTIERGGQ
jgi:hypothetical protein